MGISQTQTIIGTQTHSDNIPASIFDKSRVCQGIIANLTTETIWVPVRLHRLDDSANHKLAYQQKKTLLQMYSDLLNVLY